MQPYVVRDFLVEKNCAGDKLSDLADQLGVQGRTIPG
jgi:hypothetical protein